MTEKDNEKLSMDEMEEMAGGGILDDMKLSAFRDTLCKLEENATYSEVTCKLCGTVNRFRTDLVFAGIRTCSKCRQRI